MNVLDLLGYIVGSLLGSSANAVKDYAEYNNSGQYKKDKSTGKSRAKDMSDRSLYKEMKNNKRSAGERIAYKDELKERMN